jgi:hypothetical protein
MLTDVETRQLIANEHVRLLREQAERRTSNRRTRRWVSQHLIAAGVRLAPECAPHPRPRAA